MINRFKILLCLFAATIVYYSCKKPFSPQINEVDRNILVVDGLINAGSDSTIIKISRTTLISEKQTSNPEIDAIVKVESEDNEIFTLVEQNKGNYVSAGLNLDPAKKYRLRIKTVTGDTYLSAFVVVKLSPAIEDVTWKVEPNGLQLFASTRDVNNNSRYYRWEYDETWIFYSAWESVVKWDGKTIVPRSLNTEGIFKCWGTENSKDIVIGSSAKLDNDVIFENPITFIQSDSEKLSELYSVLVKQYVLTEGAYQFWQELQKNTETLGSIFDAQPSQLTGNIRNEDDLKEPVLGYISVGTTSEKRIYVQKTELPPAFGLRPRTYECANLTLLQSGFFKLYFENGLAVPVGPANPLRDSALLPPLYVSSKFCVDCTIRGTNKKPSFWP